MKRTVLGVMAAGALLIALAIWLAQPEPVLEIAAEAPSRALEAAPNPQQMNAVLSQPVRPSAGKGTLKGRVTAQGQPVSGATVTATRAQSDETLSDLMCQCDDHCGIALLECGCPMAAEQLQALVLERRGEVVPLARTVSSADGAFALEGLEGGTVSLWADEPKLGTALSRDVAVDREDVELTLGGSVTVTGRVVIDGDTPAAGAWVTLIHTEHSRFFDALADAQGRFTLGPVPAAQYALVAGKSGLLPGRARVGADEQREVVVALSTPRTVSGVVEENGHGVSGVAVHLEGNHKKRDAVSRGDGTFVFSELKEGAFTLTATAAALRAEAKAFVPRQGNAKPVKLQLQRAAVVAGHVTVKGRGPAAEIEVSVGDEAAWVKATTASDGSYRVLAKAAPHQNWWAQGLGVAGHHRVVDLVSGEQVIDVELEPEAVIEGVVLDAETQQPVAGANVTARELARADGESTEETEPDGTFAFKGLPAGGYQVSASYDGYVASQTKVTSPASGVQLKLGRGLKLKGIVVGPRGEPMHATVNAHRKRDATGQQTAETTDGGTFELTGLREGAYRLSAEASGHSGELEVVLPVERDQRVRLVLAAELTLSGVVVDVEGKPVAKAMVVGLKSSQTPEPAMMRGGLPTGDDGRFTLIAKSAGEYELHAFRREAPAEGFATEPTRARAGDSNIRLVLGGGKKLRGRVVDARHTPISRYGLDERLIDDPTGAFEVPLLATQTRVRIAAPGYLPHRHPIPPHTSDVDLGDIVLGEGREVRLKVRSKVTGQPLKDALLYDLQTWSAGEARVAPLATTGADGVATLHGLPDDTFAVVANHATHRPQRVDVAPNEREKTVSLDQGPTLVVTVVDEDDRPARVEVTVVPLDEKALVIGLPTDERGVVRFEGMPSGRFMALAAGERSSDSRRAHGEVTLPESGEVPLRLKLQRGAARVRLQLSPGPDTWQPTGVFLFPDGLPATDEHGLKRSLSFDHSERADPTAVPLEFAANDVPPGAWRAVVTVSRGEQRGVYTSAPFKVTPERDQRITVGPAAVTVSHGD
ncbi:MAG: carboxypeptidase regulatory-like domain-containing protein [Archangiaceae bacterium]|nr:carboxypeptidase regulatory-like domain-containing protein [Archangiaceae bacterium]